MHAHNTIILFGQIGLRKLSLEERGRKYLAAALEVVTEFPVVGGRYPVMAFGRLAAETLAFAAAAYVNQIPLEGTVVGWLYSGDTRFYIVAESIRFHLTEALRQQGVNALKQLGIPPFPAEVKVNGAAVCLPKAFEGILDERIFASPAARAA